MRDLLFVSSAIQHPRHQKRIRSLAKAFDVTVAYFQRPLYAENTFSYEGRMVDLGFIENRRYYKRLVASWRLFRELRTTEIPIVYCCSVDHALLAIWSGKAVYLEIGDLYQLGRLRWLFERLDAYVLRRIVGIVVTSPFFQSDYYSRMKNYDARKFLVVENRLPQETSGLVEEYRRRRASTRSTKKRLGIIGSIRFPNMLREINRVALRRRGDIELHLFGDGDYRVFRDTPNCFYHGPFRNPNDLPAIYEAIDVNLICYDVTDANVKLALPNKLYESVAFLKPIICSSDCKLELLVSQLGVGRATDIHGLEGAIDEVFVRYDEILERQKTLEASFYLDDDRALLNFVKKGSG